MRNLSNVFSCFFLCCSLYTLGQDSLSIKDLQPYSYPFAIENGELHGPGAEILTKAVSNAHITLLGTNNRSKLEAEFTNALIVELDRSRYKTIVLEIGSGSADILKRLSTPAEQTIANFKALNRQYAFDRQGQLFTPIPDFKSIEDAHFLQNAASRDWSILSIGTEYWTGYKMLVDELYTNLSIANKQAHQQIYQETLLLLDKLYASINGQSNAEVLQFTSALKSSEVFQTFLNEMANYQNNHALVKAFRFSLEYWNMYGNQEFYKKNLLSAENNKVQLAQTLKDKNFNFAKDKLFVRMWRNHLAKGTTINGFYGLGNMLTGMAHFHGRKSLSIGTLQRFYEEDKLIKDIVESKNFERVSYKELIPLGKKEEWILIDLRPFNKAFY